MGDMGEFWDSVKQSSRLHKTRVADQRAESAERQFEAAVTLAKESNMTLERNERGHLTLVCLRATFYIYPSLRRVQQIGGKQVKLPYYFKSDGKPWLPYAIGEIVQAYMMRWPQIAHKSENHG